MRLSKVETSKWYNSELDELHKENRDIYVKLGVGERLTYGEYELEPKNGFQVINNGDTFPLTLDNYEVYTEITNELNEGQLTVIEWLVNFLDRTGLTIIDGFHSIIENGFNDELHQVLAGLTSKEEAEVASAVAQYVLNKEDN